jgi:hypothetical protein
VHPNNGFIAEEDGYKFAAYSDPPNRLEIDIEDQAMQIGSMAV